MKEKFKKFHTVPCHADNNSQSKLEPSIAAWCQDFNEFASVDNDVRDDDHEEAFYDRFDDGLAPTQ